MLLYNQLFLMFWTPFPPFLNPIKPSAASEPYSYSLPEMPAEPFLSLTLKSARCSPGCRRSHRFGVLVVLSEKEDEMRSQVITLQIRILHSTGFLKLDTSSSQINHFCKDKHAKFPMMGRKHRDNWHLTKNLSSEVITWKKTRNPLLLLFIHNQKFSLI